ncbi:hypothetical protein KY321_05545 [Candidatus Woesearchaeota archaeon]|nr:hypothetical protein [Candidatus Woesearchaeota archaeon]
MLDKLLQSAQKSKLDPIQISNLPGKCTDQLVSKYQLAGDVFFFSHPGWARLDFLGRDIFHSDEEKDMLNDITIHFDKLDEVKKNEFYRIVFANEYEGANKCQFNHAMKYLLHDIQTEMFFDYIKKINAPVIISVPCDDELFKKTGEICALEESTGSYTRFLHDLTKGLDNVFYFPTLHSRGVVLNDSDVDFRKENIIETICSKHSKDAFPIIDTLLGDNPEEVYDFIEENSDYSEIVLKVYKSYNELMNQKHNERWSNLIKDEFSSRLVAGLNSPSVKRYLIGGGAINACLKSSVEYLAFRDDAEVWLMLNYSMSLKNQFYDKEENEKRFVIDSSQELLTSRNTKRIKDNLVKALQKYDPKEAKIEEFNKMKNLLFNTTGFFSLDSELRA